MGTKVAIRPQVSHVQELFLKRWYVLAVVVALALALTLSVRSASAQVSDVQVAAGGDDAHHTQCGWPGFNEVKPEVLVGAPGTCGFTYGGWRFAGLSIPAGATITDAWVDLNQAGWGQAMTTTLAFEDGSSPASFSLASEPADRWGRRTTYQQPWTWQRQAPESWHRTPSLKAGLQELVQKHGAVNAVVLLESGQGVPQGQYHTWTSFEGNPSLSARLHVEYTVGPLPLVVNSTSDTPDAVPGNGVCADAAGACTLRAAIEEANVRPGKDLITFNVPGPSPHTIRPGSALPAVTDPVVIDGTSEPDYSGSPVIELDGSLAGAGANGLLLRQQGEVYGLVINRFSGNGIHIDQSRGNIIDRNFIGTDLTGKLALGNVGSGIYAVGYDDRIGGPGPRPRNVISGNGGSGVGYDHGNVTIQGNFVGTDVTGTVRLGNQIYGVVGDAFSSLAVTGNVISGNGHDGVIIGSYGGTVTGNYIGVDVTGTQPMGNGGDGVNVNAKSGTTIGGKPLTLPGGTCIGDCNIISANGLNGVNGGYWEAFVTGNYIGVDVTGRVALGNGGDGVRLTMGRADANLVSANKGFGVSAERSAIILSNLVGTDVSGRGALGNGQGGVKVTGGVADDVRGNLISGNNGPGVTLTGGTKNARVTGNKIGTDITGMNRLPNTGSGVLISEGASSNLIGGLTPESRNLISGSQDYGVRIEGSGTSGNTIQGNFIGPNVNGDHILYDPTNYWRGNFGGGILVSEAPGNLIGGSTPGAGNVISGNHADGIDVFGASAAGNRIEGNRVGTSVSGMFRLDNGGRKDTGFGIVVGSPQTRVGSPAGTTHRGGCTGGCNVIYAVRSMVLVGSTATGATVQSNFIGVSIDGQTVLGATEGAGIETWSGALIGGTEAGEGNVIAEGILIRATGAVVQGNLIGTDSTGTKPLGGGYGVGIAAGTGNLIGGSVPGAGNLISASSTNGVFVAKQSTGNRILGNSIHSNQGIGIDLGGDGPTPNDPGDADPGANKLQNYPVVLSARLNAAGVLEVTYRVDSAPENSAYPLSVEFFIPDADGREGRTLLGVDTYDAANAGKAKTATLLDAVKRGYGIGAPVIATATDKDGNTSEFMPAYPRWEAEEVSVDPKNLPATGGSVGVGISTQDDASYRITGVTFTLVGPDGKPVESKPVSKNCAVADHGNYVSRCWVTTFQVPANTGLAPQTYVVAVTAAGLPGAKQGSFTVAGKVNTAPVVDAGPDQVVKQGDTVNLSLVKFSDADAGDTHTALINWGDGTPEEAGAVDQALKTVTCPHVFAKLNVFTVTVKVDDGSGGVGTDTLTVTVQPRPTNLEPRANHTVTLLRDGTVLVVGGMSATGQTLDLVVVYNPVTREVTPVGSLGQKRAGHAATLLSDGQVLVFGGVNELGQVISAPEVYDPATRSFS